MAFAIPKVSYNSMLKEGTRQFKGLEDAVNRNIEACKQMAAITRSSYGPNGMKKIVINHLDKLYITKDAATITKELEIEHPAAKIIVMASKMAEQEVGDGTNFIIQFASALLSGAEELLNFGISPSDIIDGYKQAYKKAVDILPSLVCCEVTDYHNSEQLAQAIKAVISTKQMIYCSHVADLVTKACRMSTPLYKNDFNVDNVRTVKVLGAGGSSSELCRGLAIKTEAVGTVTEVKHAKIVVFNTDFDLMNTETKGTVLLNTAKELLSFTKGEENAIKNVVADLISTGCNMIVCSGKVADQALDYANRQGIMVVRVSSKFELQRLCRATRSSSLALICLPTPEQIGHCDHVYVREIGDTQVVFFAQEFEDSNVSTIILRGSSDSVLDDLERSVDDGVNCFKSLTMNGKLLPGAGATEMELCVRLDQVASECTGLEKHAIRQFSEALKDLVRCIAENNGMKSNDVLSKMYGEHSSGQIKVGLNVETPSSVCDPTSIGIYDPFHVKSRCLQLAVDAACTILSIDQVIVARPAGGPVPKQNPNWDAD